MISIADNNCEFKINDILKHTRTVHIWHRLSNKALCVIDALKENLRTEKLTRNVSQPFLSYRKPQQAILKNTSTFHCGCRIFFREPVLILVYIYTAHSKHCAANASTAVGRGVHIEV